MRRGLIRRPVRVSPTNLDLGGDVPMVYDGTWPILNSETLAVRNFAALFLVGLIALCPVICGAAEDDHGPRHHGPVDGSHGGSPSPTHCPEDSGNCICQGAVQSGDVHVPDVDAVILPHLFHHREYAPPHPLAHLTRDGSPTGLAGWGGSLAVRAFLQNFRC